MTFAYKKLNESSCDSEAFVNANKQALAACGAGPYECLARTVGGVCGIGVADVNVLACSSAAQEALVASQVNGCSSQEYYAALGKATGICADKAAEVLAATIGTTCPTSCQAAKDNLRRTASVLYTSCGTNAYNNAADIVMNLCGPEEYSRLNAELCTSPPVDSCQDALDEAINAATSVCSYEKVSAAMANAGVSCPISCNAALYQASQVASRYGCDTWAYFQAKNTAVMMCGIG